jgi:hypothetical protein
MIWTHESGYLYSVPVRTVTNKGIDTSSSEDLANVFIPFCKGSTRDESIPRQTGVFVEDLIEVCIARLTAVNVGDLQNRYTSIAITKFEEAFTKLEEALLWLGARTNDRMQRGVATTYEK